MRDGDWSPKAQMVAKIQDGSLYKQGPIVRILTLPMRSISGLIIHYLRN